MRVGQDEALDFAAAHQSIVPAEVVVEQEVKGRRVAGAERLEGALLDFGFETAAAQGALNAAVGMEDAPWRRLSAGWTRGPAR